jgi:hypothetical protein
LKWLADDGPWWGPYLVMAVCAGIASLGVLIFVLQSAGEIVQNLRASGF